MKRTVVHIVVGLLAAFSLVFYATSLQAGNGSSLEEMLHAQKTAPLLWLLDACGLGIIFAMGFFATMLNHFQGYIDQQSQEHQQQLTAMIEHTEELQKTSDAYADRMDTLEEEFHRQQRDYRDQIHTLETASLARREVYETDARQIAQQALHSLHGQVEANTRQLEAMNMALQFQRGELRKLRQEMRTQAFPLVEPPGEKTETEPPLRSVSPPPTGYPGIEGATAGEEKGRPSGRALLSPPQADSKEAELSPVETVPAGGPLRD